MSKLDALFPSYSDRATYVSKVMPAEGQAGNIDGNQLGKSKTHGALKARHTIFSQNENSAHAFPELVARQ